MPSGHPRALLAGRGRGCGNIHQAGGGKPLSWLPGTVGPLPGSAFSGTGSHLDLRGLQQTPWARCTCGRTSSPRDERGEESGRKSPHVRAVVFLQSIPSRVELQVGAAGARWCRLWTSSLLRARCARRDSPTGTGFPHAVPTYSACRPGRSMATWLRPRQAHSGLPARPTQDGKGKAPHREPAHRAGASTCPCPAHGRHPRDQVRTASCSPSPCVGPTG